MLCVEPLNRFETSFLNLASQAIEVVDRVDHPALRPAARHLPHEHRGALDRRRDSAGGPRLKHLHACENDRGAPGSGHVPWTEVAEACRAIGYTGPAVIESFTSAVKSIARAAAIWRPFAATQDGLAQDGLRHLRKLFGATYRAAGRSPSRKSERNIVIDGPAEPAGKHACCFG